MFWKAVSLNIKTAKSARNCIVAVSSQLIDYDFHALFELNAARTESEIKYIACLEGHAFAELREERIGAEREVGIAPSAKFRFAVGYGEFDVMQTLFVRFVPRRNSHRIVEGGSAAGRHIIREKLLQSGASTQ